MSPDARYPITDFLTNMIEESGLSEVKFVKRLGYPHSPEKGIRRLRLWMETGFGYDRIVREICAAYPDRREELEAALERTKIIKAGEAEAIRKSATAHIQERLRRGFKPFIWANTEDGPHSFWSAVLEVRAKTMTLDDDFCQLPEP
jgi:hypothetical protein